MLQDFHYATPYSTMSSNTLPFEYSPILVWVYSGPCQLAKQVLNLQAQVMNL
jgi:hypothetical protein